MSVVADASWGQHDHGEGDGDEASPHLLTGMLGGEMI